MLKIIEEDILTVKTGNIFQQVNCMGVMRSGLAKAIKDKYPIVESRYLELIGRSSPLDLLGSVQCVEITVGLNVINIFGQYSYGGQIKHTEYAALKQAFKTIKDGAILHSNNIVAFPYNFGSDRGGGSWSIVSTIIEDYFPHAVIYKLPS